MHGFRAAFPRLQTIACSRADPEALFSNLQQVAEIVGLDLEWRICVTPSHGEGRSRCGVRTRRAGRFSAMSISKTASWQAFPSQDPAGGQRRAGPCRHRFREPLRPLRSPFDCLGAADPGQLAPDPLFGPLRRQLMEQMQYNLLFHWFVGLGIDDPVWVLTVFTKNRDRLLSTETSRGIMGPRSRSIHLDRSNQDRSDAPRPPPQPQCRGRLPGAEADECHPWSGRRPGCAALQEVPRHRRDAVLHQSCPDGEPVRPYRAGRPRTGRWSGRTARDMIHRHSPGSTRRLMRGCRPGLRCCRLCR